MEIVSCGQCNQDGENTMIRIILIWIGLSIGIALGVQTVRHMNQMEMWDLTKTILFSTMCSLAALVVMFLIVILF